jgi:hypothetical protein
MVVAMIVIIVTDVLLVVGLSILVVFMIVLVIDIEEGTVTHAVFVHGMLGMANTT